MDKMFDVGLEQRKATLGAEYVENTLQNADDFTRPFQEAMTAWCWGSAGVMMRLTQKHGR